AYGAQRGRRQRTAVATHPHHEVSGFEQLGVVVAGEAAVVALLTLGVQAPPAEAAAQITLVDAVEAVLGVDGLDALAYVQGGAGLLHLFVRVQRLTIPQCPLALVTGLRGSGGGHRKFSFKKIAGAASTVHRYFWAARNRLPAGDTVGLGLPSQGRQIQLQTRLRSMCRRATSTTCGPGRSTVTSPLCHGC